MPKTLWCKLDWTRHVVVELDDHHDSAIINAGLAADAGYRGTFGHEAEDSLDELRETFRRKAHTAAMERCLTALLRAQPQRPGSSLGEVRLADLPDDATTDALLKRRRGTRIVHGARRFGLGRPPGRRIRARRRAAGVAAGQVHPDLHRRQRPLLPRTAADPLRRRRRKTFSPAEHPDDQRRSNPMSTMRAVQVVGYHQNLEMKEVPAPDADGTVRRRREDRRRGGVPHRPAHPRGPVGARSPRSAAAVHDRPRERRLGARDRLGGHQRRRGRQGDPAPADHLRAVPGVPLR